MHKAASWSFWQKTYIPTAYFLCLSQVYPTAEAAEAAAAAGSGAAAGAHVLELLCWSSDDYDDLLAAAQRAVSAPPMISSQSGSTFAGTRCASAEQHSTLAGDTKVHGMDAGSSESKTGNKHNLAHHQVCVNQCNYAGHSLPSKGRKEQMV